MIEFEKEVVEYLGLPNIPKKEWDGYTPFDKGVAVVKLCSDTLAYAVCSYNPENGDNKVLVNKVFSIETFTDIVKVFVVPNYMTNISDIQDMDLDDESKSNAESMLSDAIRLENEGVVEDEYLSSDNEYYFDNISNDEEARAFIKAFNKRNKIKGRIPKTHDGLLMRLSVIYSEQKNK